MPPSHILFAHRLPVGKQGGVYKAVIPEDFTAHLISESLKQMPGFVSHDIEQLILGTSLGTGGNMARYTALQAGLALNTAATTIDSQCASGLSAIAWAHQKIVSGQSLILAGGMESCSLAPERSYAAHDPRKKRVQGHYAQAQFAPESMGDNTLIHAAEALAHDCGISKMAMQQYCLESHAKAEQALENEYYSSKIIAWQGQKRDEALKKNLSMARLQASQKSTLIDHSTAAHRNDGAAICLLASTDYCKAHELKAQFTIKAIAETALAPNRAPWAMLSATEQLLAKQQMPIEAIDCFELSESFAINPLAFAAHFKVSRSKINTFGGNLAYGHPFGASGAINFVHLLAQMQQQAAQYGLVALPAAGGLGLAVLVENIDA